jgi:hypothetical protein
VADGITWLLGRSPQRYFQVPGTKYRIYEMANLGLPGIPVLRVVYWFDENMVYLVDAMLVEQSVDREV